MSKQKRKININQWITIVVFLSLFLSILYAVIHIIVVPSAAASGHEKLKSDYFLMLLQCILGLFVMILPSILEKRLKFEMPGYMHIVLILFLYCAIYLGEVQAFYYTIPHWDTVLHAFSGVMLGTVGFTVVDILNASNKVRMTLSPLFVAVFSFCFAVALGVLWEIYEYSFDSLFGLNMQKYALENGSPLTGNAALADTMKDLIVDSVGALGMAIIGYFSLKRNKKWINRFDIKKTDGQTPDQNNTEEGADCDDHYS